MKTHPHQNKSPTLCQRVGKCKHLSDEGPPQHHRPPRGIGLISRYFADIIVRCAIASPYADTVVRQIRRHIAGRGEYWICGIYHTIFPLAPIDVPKVIKGVKTQHYLLIGDKICEIIITYEVIQGAIDRYMTTLTRSIINPQKRRGIITASIYRTIYTTRSCNRRYDCRYGI